MSSLDDLKNITPRPNSVKEWLESFQEEDRETIIRAMDVHTPAQIFPILAKLEFNPFPFRRDTLAKYMRGKRDYA